MSTMMNSHLRIFLLLTLLRCLTAYEMYDSASSTCCNGTVQPWQTGSRCCGNRTYRIDQHICCFGQLVPLPGKGTFGCCGNRTSSQVFQYGTHECCHQRVVQVPDATRYYGCCGQRVYYPDEETCCDGVVTAASENRTCCGAQMMDENTQLCCQIWTNINGSVELTSVVHPLVDDRQACCGLRPIDWKTEMCCGYRIHPRNQSVSCCGGRVLYNAATHVCCHGRIYQKQNGVDLECCWMAKALYNPDTHFCCDSEVVPLAAISGNRTSCCSMSNHGMSIYGH